MLENTGFNRSVWQNEHSFPIYFKSKMITIDISGYKNIEWEIKKFRGPLTVSQQSVIIFNIFSFQHHIDDILRKQLVFSVWILVAWTGNSTPRSTVLKVPIIGTTQPKEISFMLDVKPGMLLLLLIYYY